MARIKGSEKTGGRVKGSKNKTTAEIKLLARNYGGEALDMIVRIMRSGTEEKTRLMAAKEILDRGYGKPTQDVSNEDGSLEKRIVILDYRNATDKELKKFID